MRGDVRGRWVGTWTTTPAAVEGIGLKGQTVRMIAHVSLGGEQLRVHVSNAYGAQKLRIGAASVGLRGEGGAIVPGSNRPLTFAGQTAVAVPVGALVLSDPIDLALPALSDLAVSLFLPDDVPDGQVTGHGNAHQTNYISSGGDHTSTVEMPIAGTTDAFLYVTGVDVLAAGDAGGVVALGDSLTDANISQLDANHRWPDQLARRLAGRTSARPIGVMNQGIGGNRILHDVRGDSGLRRFDRDVLAQPGVTHAIVLLGINDIRNRNQKPEEVVTAEEMIWGLHQLVDRAHVHGVKIVGGTLLTFENETFNPGFYSVEGEEKRQAVNAWIRASETFDAVIDFEAALRDPRHPTRMLPEYDCGDHLHPSDAGYLRMGDEIDLALFD
jgi:lysophospholipase L1-like esterase